MTTANGFAATTTRANKKQLYVYMTLRTTFVYDLKNRYLNDSEAPSTEMITPDSKAETHDSVQMKTAEAHAQYTQYATVSTAVCQKLKKCRTRTREFRQFTGDQKVGWAALCGKGSPVGAAADSDTVESDGTLVPLAMSLAVVRVQFKLVR